VIEIPSHRDRDRQHTNARRIPLRGLHPSAVGGSDGNQILTSDADGVAEWADALPSSIGGSIPIGGVIDYYGTTEPDGWLFCDGSAIPAVYADAIAIIGANTPDLRGRVTVGLDNMGGSDAGRLSVANTLGGTGGAESANLAVGELPTHTHNVSVTGLADDHVHELVDNVGAAMGALNVVVGAIAGGSTGATGYFIGQGNQTYGANTGSATGTIAVTASGSADTIIGYPGGGQTSLSKMQPYGLSNKLIRVA
jgi:microcystin-dependent protein